jgi:hypothetical protein
MSKKKTTEPCNYAVIEDTHVVNMVVWDGVTEWSPPDGDELVCIKDFPHVGIGWDYIDGEFVDNRPPEPSPFDE